MLLKNYKTFNSKVEPPVNVKARGSSIKPTAEVHINKNKFFCATLEIAK